MSFLVKQTIGLYRHTLKADQEIENENFTFVLALPENSLRYSYNQYQQVFCHTSSTLSSDR